MPLLTKECLERLRDKINLIEIVGSHIDLKKVGAKTKALCPFHNEKTPSFTLNPGDSHYHCFGCGAHGDGVAFLMNFLGISFREAVEYLANKYGVRLEFTGEQQAKDEYKRDLYRINQKIAEFFHFHLLHSEEGKIALEYLFKRGITEEFIKKFMIGYAPHQENFQKAFYRSEKFSEELLVLAGILSESTKRVFFTERIMFPIHDGMSNVVGFSGRKINEEVFGGKYVNTKETKIFKKSRTLYGLNYSRRRIAKDGKVIIVEGQIDALRFINEDLDYAVASQGTAFGELHVAELMKLSVEEVIICFDGDSAGDKSALKVGQLFQKEGVEVNICRFPDGMDPDTFLIEYGKEGFEKLYKAKKSYLTFLVQMLSKDGKADSPAGKNALMSEVKKMMKDWKHPLMIHEGEKQLARLLNVPGKFVVTTAAPQIPKAVKKVIKIAADVLEEDLVRWLLLIEDKKLLSVIFENIETSFLGNELIKKVFEFSKELFEEGREIDMLHLGASLDENEMVIIENFKSKRMNVERVKEGVRILCQKLLDREWLKRCDEIKEKIKADNVSEDKLFALAKEFAEVKKNKKIITEIA
ncbi:MAG: DNA primase [Chlamydiia bacterium]|nr:DNA primase [Chlamydiia bacterium]